MDRPASPPSDSESYVDEKLLGNSAPAQKRRRLHIYFFVGLAVLAVIGLAVGLGLHFGMKPPPPPPTVAKTTGFSKVEDSLKGPTVDSNFADPCHIKVEETYYSFATNKYVHTQPGQVHIQVANSSDFETWNLTTVDALPTIGNWSTGEYVWAPDVVQLDNGKFVMYYSAENARAKRTHCLGAATSDTVTGPYTPLPTPIVCPLDQGGAIDPEGFKDVDGTRYLIYKVDGNSLNKASAPLHPTPLMLQELRSDGLTLVGAPIQLVDREKGDGPLVEAPAMGRYDPGNGADAIYVLFFSSNVFTTPHYNVEYATSKSVKGPFTRAAAPLLKTGDASGQLVGPGGMDVGVSSTQVVFHSIRGQTPNPRMPVTRPMWVGQISIDGETVTI